jgi:hypothetical protein
VTPEAAACATSAALIGDALIARLQANAEMTFSVESYRFAGGGIDDGGTASISLPA